MSIEADLKHLDGVKEDYEYGFHDEEKAVYKAGRGLNHGVVDEISDQKNEPDWMRKFRHEALDIFFAKAMPEWGADLSGIDFDEIFYYLRASEEQGKTWDDVPEDIKNTFERLGIPEAERKFLAGVGAQYDSESVYHSLREEWSKLGVVFMDMDEGLREYEDLIREYFATIIPAADNKFAALNSAVWSGGSFVYVPKGVQVDIPLQAYFRINAENMGQFERTLIIVEEGASMHYVEGCTAPVYSSNSLHSAVVEIIIKKDARCRYTTIQNWSTDVYNLVTKRAIADENATMEWIDGNLGCLAEGSTVTTPTGIKNIEHLIPGEKVLSFDEANGELCFRTVVAKKFSGFQPVHEVSYGERRLLATSNHPFYSYQYSPENAKKSGRYQLGYVRADELTEAILPATSIDFGQPYELDAPATETTFMSSNQYGGAFEATRGRLQRIVSTGETTDDLMWLFGLFLGDGDIYRKLGENSGVTRYAKVGFSVPQTNRARQKLVTTMAGVIEEEPYERADGVHLTWNSVELADFFEDNGFTSGAKVKRLPYWVYSTPESQRLALLAGYLDSDGHVSTSARRFSIKSINRDLLGDVARLATSLGITTRIYTEFDEPREVTIMGTRSTAQPSHRISLPLDSRILPYLTEDMQQKAKAVPASKLIQNRKVGRSNIELPDSVEIVKTSVSDPSAEAVPTWDIEVDGTGNFVSEGFIVHNSKVTMKYPAVYMMGPKAHGEILSIAFAGTGQHQDAGGKVVHAAPNTSSKIISKSISKDGGRASYRGLLKVAKGAHNSRSTVVCDALLLDEASRSDTYPYIEIEEDDVSVGHEASVSKIGEEQLFYLMSRGIGEEEASAMIVGGFIEPLVKELPMEYAVEMNRLIQLQMEGSIG